jgi:hypothetical protein
MHWHEMTRLPFFIALALICGVAQGADHEISVSVAKTFRLGDPLVMEIVHRNNSAVAWKLLQPDRSPKVWIKYLPIDKKEPIGGGFYGQGFGALWVETTILGKKVLVVEDPPRGPKIEIAPQSEYRFKHDMYDPEDFDGWVIPGHWKAWAVNEVEKLEGDPVEFDIVYCVESIDMLQAVALDTKWTRSARDAAIKWLQKVRPEMEVMDAYPDLTRFKVPQEYIDRVHERNRVNFEKFDQWWKANRDTREVQELIDGVNRRYGLDPEKARKAVAEMPRLKRTPPKK